MTDVIRLLHVVLCEAGGAVFPVCIFEAQDAAARVTARLNAMPDPRGAYRPRFFVGEAPLANELGEAISTEELAQHVRRAMRLEG